MKEKAKRIELKIFAPQAENVHLCGSFNHWSESADPMKKDSTAKFAPNITGDVGSMTAYALARLCYDTLLEYGLAAKISCEAHAVTPALEHVVEANTLLSGLGFVSGGLAAAHAIHNGFTVLEKVHDQQHGEKVAFGTLVSLYLTDKPGEVIDEVYAFCESMGLPTTFEGMVQEYVLNAYFCR